MCGQYTLSISLRIWDKWFLPKDASTPDAGDSIAPGQPVPSIRGEEGSADHTPNTALSRRGPIPFWTENKVERPAPFQARSLPKRKGGEKEHATLL